MTIYLIGESNPYGADPYYALYPQPSNATGGRLCKALGLTDDEYLDKYERRNLLVGSKWSAPKAREAAAQIVAEMANGDALVLLGAKVAAAFLLNFATQLLMPVVYRADRRLDDHPTNRHPCVVIPHPSGLSRIWAQPGMKERVRVAVEALEGAVAV